ncbi:MAG: bacteriochlorophyll 4-vinyl reductase [Pseudomonadota bacterium]
MLSIAPATIGPNAIIQIVNVVRDVKGDNAVRLLLTGAGLGVYADSPPTEMVPEQEVTALHHAVFEAWPDDASPILKEAGRRTADYVMAYRIPAFARGALKVLPRALSAPLLLSAIERNSWTFAGSGAFAWQASPAVLTITHNPVMTPGCPWHCGVFERLFEVLVGRGYRAVYAHRPSGEGGLCEFTLNRQ